MLLLIAVHGLHQRIDILLEVIVMRVDAKGSAHRLTRGSRDRRQQRKEQLLLQRLLQLLALAWSRYMLQLGRAGRVASFTRPE